MMNDRGLSAFYDNDQYGQHRRGNEIRISIKSPKLTSYQVQRLATLLNSSLRMRGNRDLQVVLSWSSLTKELSAMTLQTTTPPSTET